MFRHYLISTVATLCLMSINGVTHAQGQGQGNGNNQGPNENAAGDVEVVKTSCNEVEITSTKGIGKIVYEVDGVHYTTDGTGGKSFTLTSTDPLTTIWVKSGNNLSGDGPGYGERFEIGAGNVFENMTMHITADDYYEIFVNGELQDATNNTFWGRSDLLELNLDACGENVIAVKVRDIHKTAKALLATAYLDGNVYTATGLGQWKVTTTDPGPGWNTLTFDDSAWDASVVCKRNYWGLAHQDILSSGANWIWNEEDCYAPKRIPLESGWFRLRVEN